LKTFGACASAFSRWLAHWLYVLVAATTVTGALILGIVLCSGRQIDAVECFPVEKLTGIHYGRAVFPENSLGV
jgi:hypothetical protein